MGTLKLHIVRVCHCDSHLAMYIDSGPKSCHLIGYKYEQCVGLWVMNLRGRDNL